MAPPVRMPDPAATPVYSKDNPFPARILENRLLSGPGSNKETRHLVVDLAGSGLAYRPGESLGVFPSNRPLEVERLLERLGAGGCEPVVVPRTEAAVPLREALGSKLALAGPTRRFVETLAARSSDPAEKADLSGLLAPESKERLEAWLAEREYIDLLEEFPGARLGPQDFVSHLRRLVPRLYSVASSQRVHPAEAHLTVAVVRYATNGRERVGVCSTFLADRAETGGTPVPVFVSHSNFGLPEDGSRDLIMVGPGTGIAPFRAFVQDRAATGARGRNWVFYGDQKRACDFLYEEDWSRWLREGSVARFDTAFSRDQEKKVYVQDRMREHAAELWAWIRGGACFYVCGDANRMPKDVDGALHEIIGQQGGLTPTQVIDYIKVMKKEKRYQRDIY